MRMSKAFRQMCRERPGCDGCPLEKLRRRAGMENTICDTEYAGRQLDMIEDYARRHGDG